MPMKRNISRDDHIAQYDREMLRSAFVSLFWNIISFKRVQEKFDLKALADRVGINKSEPSRWFSGARPNWTVNTISDIANALDVDIELRATDRATGKIFLVSGPVINCASPAATIPAPNFPIYVCTHGEKRQIVPNFHERGGKNESASYA